MGEALYVYFLIVSTKSSANKQREIDLVPGWSPTPLVTPPDLVAGLTPGIATPAWAFHTYRHIQVGFLIEFVERLKKQDPAERRRLVNDPWAFKDFLEETRLRRIPVRNNYDTPRIQQEALLHLVHPDSFEAIVNTDDKKLAPLDLWTPPDIEALAKELLWETGELQKIIDGLKDKGQVIFQGPPGTGKTFVAKRIAEWCRDYGGDFQIVQFHPSYSYEDFVEGFRPTLSEGGQAGFELREGPLRRMASEAEASPDATCSSW